MNMAVTVATRAAITAIGCLFLGFFALTPSAGQELRGMWVDGWRTGFKSPAQTDRLLSDARAGNFNALFIQVRKRADAYYRSAFEPMATDISPIGYDPLADLIEKAHTGEQPIEIHAWMNSYIVGSTLSPSNSQHPVRLHRDWLTENVSGDQWNGANYQFDPGHPGVLQYTFDVAMDIITRYEVDGLHFDYIRYSEYDSAANANIWGYNPVAVERYNRLYDQSGTPTPSARNWSQFKRDQITALVRKTYLHTLAQRPEVRISVAAIPWGSAPSTTSQASFQSSAAWSLVMQDWRGWTEEGIIDLAIPMVYRNHTSSGSAFNQWNTIAKRMQFGRATAIGAGFYLNGIGETLEQIKFTRRTASGQKSAGLVGFSYGVPTENGSGRSTLLAALTDPQIAASYDPGSEALFGDVTTVPLMPWKSDLALAHAMGTLVDAEGNAIDGARILLEGAEARTLTTDGTGFFGAVDLSPGDYTITASEGGAVLASESTTLTGAMVALVDMEAGMPVEVDDSLVIESVTYTDAPEPAVSLQWRSIAGETYNVDFSTDLTNWSTIGLSLRATGTATTYTDRAPDSRGATNVYYRVRRR
ncbi:MAG: uncharacterized lipoprotein YddW (UPF0748 family) [Verrucomicrobiales bacterium]|jgi:uncharacterized lipoprotein YddW (UPF0748 family)